MLSKPAANSWSESNSASLHQTQGASLRDAVDDLDEVLKKIEEGTR